MAKPKAPAWLTTAFAEGVIELAPPRPRPAYKGALGRCWLAQHDERRRPCSGRLERAHLIPRQRVENALGALLPSPVALRHKLTYVEATTADKFGREVESFIALRRDLILLAAWDSRNAVIGCEGHHRRLDNHTTPALVIRQSALPAHAFDFANDWGLENALNDRFPL